LTAGVTYDRRVTGATTATTSSRALMAACAKLGLDTREILAAAGLTAAQLDDPDGQVSCDRVAVLWQAALASAHDADLGLQAAVAVPFGAYRVIDFLAASAPTVGEGFVRVARYFPLINPTLELRIHEAATEVAVELAAHEPAALPRPLAEFVLAVTFLHCRRASGREWPLRRATFAFPAPADPAAHARVFGAPVRFGQPRTELVLARDVWQLPSHNASLELLRTLEDHADRLLANQRARELEARVARVLAEELRGGDPSLVHVARRVGMSARTLQRRLADEGVSFADLVDRTRREFAEDYLRDRSLALSEIAYLLGFSEQSAFTRAFQRWHGTSPSRYREQAAS